METSVIQKNWADLNIDVLRKIFGLLPKKGLFIQVSGVCKWWQYACSDLFSWNSTGAETLDFGDVKEIIRDYSRSQERFLELKMKCQSRASGRILTKEDIVHMRLERRNAYEGRLFQGLNYVLTHASCKDNIEAVSELILPQFLHVTNDHLIHLSSRMRNVKKLTLLDAEKITSFGFREASLNWKKLEYLHIGPICNEQVMDMITSLSANCSNLKVVHFYCFSAHVKSKERNFELGEEISRAITDIHQLEHLTIEGIVLYDYSLGIILRGCEKLKRFDIIWCQRLFTLPKYQLFAVELQKDGIYWYIDGKDERAFGVDDLIHHLNANGRVCDKMWPMEYPY